MIYVGKFKKIIYLLCWIFFIIIIPFLLANSINRNTFYIKVNSNSMYPTVQEDDMLLVINNYININRGDIIIFHSTELNRMLIKRVVGIPGDTIYIDNNNNFVINNDIIIESNGLYNDESYIYKEIGINNKLTIKDGEYFVVGDNINNSFDSRLWNDTFVSSDLILGKAILLLKPLRRFSIFY